MKKVLCLLAVVLSLFVITACKSGEPLVISESDTFVVVKCQTDKSDLTLSKYMDGLSDVFVIENGMVVSINGQENASDWSHVWMLYTDDSELSNSAWGTIEYEGKVYGSAVSGAESLIVKNGCVYIWVYQEF